MKRASIPMFVLPGMSLSVAREGECRVSTDFAMPARFEARLRLTECNHSGGPLVVLRVVMVLPGLEARVVFRADATAGPDDSQSMRRVPFVPSGERVLRAPRWARGTPGSARICLAMVDRDGRPLAPEIDAGESVDGITNLDIPFVMGVSAVEWVGARGWSEQRGPLIRLSGELVSTRGVMVRLGFRSPEGRLGGSGEGETEFPLIRPGMTFYSRETTFEAGHTGNPWVAVQFVDETGHPIGGEKLVGRFVRA